MMPILMGSCFFPYVMVALLEHLEIKHLRFIPVALIKQSIVSDKALAARVDLALESLAPRKGGKK